MPRFGSILSIILCMSQRFSRSNAHIVRIYTGEYLDTIPGHVAAHGHQLERAHLDISLVDVEIEGPPGTDGQPLVRFTSKAFRNNRTGQIWTFGPTVRVRKGGNFTIRFTNDLVAGPGETLSVAAHNHLTLPSFTNLHTHGLWGDPGVRAQPPPGEAPPYQGHDNVFIAVAPRPNASVPHGDTVQYTHKVPHNHMPGVAWYHPHFHGSSGLQTVSAKGVVVIEGEEEYFTPEGGCELLSSVLLEGGIKEWIMQVESWFFGGTTTSSPSPIQDVSGDKPDDHDSYPNLSQRSKPPNPTCCNSQEGFMSAGQDFMTVNGAYQPVVKMWPGVWQRWRLLYTSYMRYLDLTWVTEAGEDAPCEVMLLAKDGVYLQQIPRAVNHVLLPPGGRADLVVRCSAPADPATRLVVRSGYGPMSWSPAMCNAPTCRVMKQPTLMTIELQDPPSPDTPPLPEDHPLEQESCTPLRPSHLADLRDEALQAAAFDRQLLVQDSIFFTPAKMGDMGGRCAVNGEFFSFPDSNPLMAPLGTVVEWGLRQSSFHPHHLHTVPMQVVELPDIASGGGGGMGGGMGSGRGGGGASKEEIERAWAKLSTYFKVGDHHDTLLLPVGGRMGGAATVRFQPGHFTGYSVHHCHYLQHEDEGCMKIVKWECPGYPGNYQPEDCEFEFPVKGTFPWGPRGELLDDSLKDA